MGGTGLGRVVWDLSPGCEDLVVHYLYHRVKNMSQSLLTFVIQ